MSGPLILLVTHSEHADPGAVGEALQRQGYRTRTCCPMLGDKLPRLQGGRADGVSAVIVFGGPQCVSEIEQYPYLRDEIAWIGTLVKAGAPVLAGKALARLERQSGFAGTARPGVQANAEGVGRGGPV